MTVKYFVINDTAGSAMVYNEMIMKKMWTRTLRVALFVLMLALGAGTQVAFAHEVYVLDRDEINSALQAPSPDFIATVHAHLGQFFTWGLLTLAIIVAIFFLSITRPIERAINPVLSKLKTIAPQIAQATLGLSLLASGYYHAMFGVELPMQAIFGAATPLTSTILIALGIMLTFGILPRVAALSSVILFGALVGHYGIYMTNYATYLGEALTVLLFGGAYHIIESKRFGATIERIEGRISPALHKYKFLIMRILFGVSLIYASIYAKLIHGALALETVSKYHLTNYFHFDPVFLVLGAMTIEIMLGLFFALGFEIRFASIFFLIFLTMSLLFFGEAVWPHLILIGTALAMFAHGYDQYCISAKLSLRRNQTEGLEPVL